MKKTLILTVCVSFFLIVCASVVQAHVVTVTVSPEAGGYIHSYPSGIACPSDCSLDFTQGTEIILTAEYNTGYQFDHWEGDVTGTESYADIIADSPKNITAVFVPVQNPQTLTVTVSPEASGTVHSYPYGIVCPTDCSFQFPQRAEVNLTAEYKTGYQFDHWEGDATGTNTSATLIMDSQKRVTAIFVPVQNPQTLTVTVSPEAGGTVHSYPYGIACPTDCSFAFPKGVEISLTPEFKTGYQFDHWEGDATGNEPVWITMDSPRNVTAVFVQVQEPKTLTVNVSPQAGGTVHSYPSGIWCPNDCSFEFPKNSEINLTADYKTGYQFDHWEGALTGSGNSKTLTLTDNLSVTAVFVQVQEPRTLTVNVSPQAGGTVHSYPSGIWCPTDCSFEFPKNSEINLTADYKTGYQFDHWEGALTGSSNSKTLTLTDNLSVTAVFVQVQEPKTLTVNVSPQAGGTVHSYPSGIWCPTDCSFEFPKNSEINLTADYKTGYQFDHWEGALTGSGNSKTLTLTDNLSVTAVFVLVQEPRTLTVKVSPQEGGLVNSDPSGIWCPNDKCSFEFPKGSEITLTANYKTGYQFDHWEGALTGSGNSKTLTLTDNLSVTAVFVQVQEPRTLTVKVSPQEGGLVNSDPSGIWCPNDKCSFEFPKGSEITLTANYKTGYQFDHWEGALTGSGNSKTLTLTDNLSVTAVFVLVQEPRTLTVKVSPQEAGLVNSDPSGIWCPNDKCSFEFPKGSEITLTANYNTGYQFDHWEGALTGSGNSKTLTLTDNLSVTAVFVPVQEPRTLTVKVSPSEGGLVKSDPSGIWCPTDCSFEFPKGSEITLTVSYNTGYQFDHWEGALTGSKYDQHLILDEDKTVTAVFNQGTSVVDSLNIAPGIDKMGLIMISFPYHLDNPDSQSLFTGVTWENYGTDFRMGVYDPMIGDYNEYGSFSVAPGRALWMLARNGLNIPIQGTYVNNTYYIALRLAYNSSTGDGWNMVAPPDKREYDWENMMVVQYKNAVSDEIQNGPAYIRDLTAENSYIDRRIWRWENGDYISATSLRLKPFEGYWVKAKMPNVALKFYADTTKTVQVEYRLERSLFDDAGDRPPSPIGDFESSVKDDVDGGCFISTVMNDE